MHVPLLSRLWSQRKSRQDCSREKTAWASASPVRVCFSGRDLGGSWLIRGAQMAATRLNWAAIPEPAPKIWDKFDVFCFVKHPVPELMKALKDRGKKVVLDVVDGWRQPEEDRECSDAETARRLFSEKWAGLPADAWIYPNQAMWEDLSGRFPGTAIYHHYYPGLVPTAPREQARVVGYQGEARFLGPWQEILQRLCEKLGLIFQVNPSALSEVDIGFAGRGGAYDSFLANRYKSNVKLANFLGAGLPCVVSGKENAYRETEVKGVRFFSTEAELEAALRVLVSREEREKVQKAFLASRDRFSLQTVASQFDAFFSGL